MECKNKHHSCNSCGEKKCGSKHNCHSADMVEVRHGEWKQVNEKAPRYSCSVCNHLYNNKEYKYCPFCGAKMDGESEGDKC